MNETDIKTMLDTLADYQARRDLLESEKHALLEEVKIPAEVETIVKNGMKQMGEAEMSFIPAFEAQQKEAEVNLAKIVVPEEIKVALAEIDRQRAEVNAKRAEQDAEVRQQIQTAKAEIQAKVEAETKGVYDALQQRRAEIEAEFAGKAEVVDDNIKKLTEEIKVATKDVGVTVKGQYYMAVYVKGRVSWNNDMLDGMIALVPQLEQARKYGEPSITIRRI
jgi:phage host-nuclease inhibitor protein Gam